MKINYLAITASIIAVNGFALADAASASNFQSIGLTDTNSLVIFSVDRPDKAKTRAITGLQAGETLLGIDFRPANNELYGITNNNLYIIDVDTGVATLQRPLNIRADAGSFSGVDFNPRPDLLRLVNGNDENFRLNVVTGEVFDDSTLSDGKLKYAAGDVNAGANPNVNAIAYTNSFAPSPDPNRVTLLYGLDTDLDVLVLQDPPNNGILTTIGNLGVDFDDRTSFDIFSPSNDVNLAFASSGSNLFRIDLSATASGNRALLVGSIGNGSNNIVGLASRATPEPSALGALAVISLFGFSGLNRKKTSD
jgi:hypothetical protein